MKIDELRRLLREPSGHELEIGRTLLAMRSNGEFPEGFSSLRGFIVSVRGSVDYSTAMKWVRAAEHLAGRTDWVSTWPVSQALELLRIPEGAQREDFVSTLDPAAPVPSVRALRGEIRRFMGAQPGPTLPTAPHEVVAQAVRVALEQAGVAASSAGVTLAQGRAADGPGAVLMTADVDTPVAARAVAISAEVLGEILTARQAWRKRTSEPSSIGPCRCLRLTP